MNRDDMRESIYKLRNKMKNRSQTAAVDESTEETHQTNMPTRSEDMGTDILGEIK